MACGLARLAATWSEFDLERGEWTIPAERMKKVKGGAKPFMVPLTDAIIDVLRPFPDLRPAISFLKRLRQASTKPANFSDPKEQLDALMLEERQVARRRQTSLPDFVNHDIRRTVRTHLSALRIGEEVREAVLAHVRPGIKGVYDKHQY